MSARDQLPRADDSRAEFARRLFSEGLSPEEFAARYAHTIACFSLNDVRYDDGELDRWIGRLGDIFFDRNGAPTVEELRRRLLSEDERRRIEAESAGEF